MQNLIKTQFDQITNEITHYHIGARTALKAYRYTIGVECSVNDTIKLQCTMFIMPSLFIMNWLIP
jgi:hypothetical protein